MKKKLALNSKIVYNVGAERKDTKMKERLLDNKAVAFLIRLGFKSMGLSTRKVKVEGTKDCINVYCRVAGLDHERMKKMLLKFNRVTAQDEVIVLPINFYDENGRYHLI